MAVGLVSLLVVSAWPAGAAWSPQATRAGRGARAQYISYESALPVIRALPEQAPEALGSAADGNPARWAAWCADRDRDIRSRLALGDEDSVINFLLLGNSFTAERRLTLEVLAETNRQQSAASAGAVSPEGAQFLQVLNHRIDDLIKGVRNPGGNERLAFARAVLSAHVDRVDTPAGQTQGRLFLLRSLKRVLDERTKYASDLQAASKSSAEAEISERATLFSDRGLSADTSILPDFAVEEAIKALKAQAVIRGQSVRRVAVVGPGLDFTDKQDGYDFYPEQTIQPYGIIDTLLRTGLAARDLNVTTLDISPRVNAHLSRAAGNARRGLGYTVQLPRDDDARWGKPLVDYWSSFGDEIGVAADPAPAPASFTRVHVRAVRIDPKFVLRITPVDLNVVLQHLDLPVRDRFDLVVATNIFVYYGPFEQALALENVARMLSPKGILLTNNILPNFPAAELKQAGSLAVPYSDRPSDGDNIFWYRIPPRS